MSWLPRIFLCIAAALLLAFGSAAGHAQQKPPPLQGKEAAKPEAKRASAAQTKRAAANEGKSRRHQDARHCLDQPSNAAIIRCAEAYL
jgi:hypothetical protein